MSREKEKTFARDPWWAGSLLSAETGVAPFGFRSAVLGGKRVETLRRIEVSRRM